MKGYKLTSENNLGLMKTKWGENVTHEAPGKTPILCTGSCIHFYRSPLLAILMNPIEANIKNPKLWEVEADEPVVDDGTKCGSKRVTTLRVVDLPKITTTQRVAFGILAAKQVYKKKKWNSWADNWLSGKDRSGTSAGAAYKKITYEPYDNGIAAANATYAACHIAGLAVVPSALFIAFDAADGAAYAALAASGIRANKNIDLCAIAEEAMKYK